MQQTPEWFATRCGKATASRMADIFATTKTGPAASRKNYLAQLVAERLTGTVETRFSSAAMQWGVEHEPLARAEYELLTDVMVDQVDFVDHPTIPFSGASPDGLVNHDGLLEIKCPNTSTHIAYLLAGVVPEEYKPQMLWQIACTRREWVDFVSYDPRMPAEMRLFVRRFSPKQEDLQAIETAVTQFLAEVDDTLAKLAQLKAA